MMSSTLYVFVCGARGVIFRSADLGVTWRRLPSPTTCDLHVIRCAHVQTENGVHPIVLAAGANGTVIQSFDYGVHWTTLTLFQSSNASMLSSNSPDSKHNTCSPESSPTIRDVQMRDQIMVLVGDKGFCAISHNAGRHWWRIPIPSCSVNESRIRGESEPIDNCPDFPFAPFPILSCCIVSRSQAWRSLDSTSLSTEDGNTRIVLFASHEHRVTNHGKTQTISATDDVRARSDYTTAASHAIDISWRDRSIFLSRNQKIDAYDHTTHTHVVRAKLWGIDSRHTTNQGSFDAIEDEFEWFVRKAPDPLFGGQGLVRQACTIHDGEPQQWENILVYGVAGRYTEYDFTGILTAERPLRDEQVEPDYDGIIDAEEEMPRLALLRRSKGNDSGWYEKSPLNYIPYCQSGTQRGVGLAVAHIPQNMEETSQLVVRSASVGVMCSFDGGKSFECPLGVQTSHVAISWNQSSGRRILSTDKDDDKCIKTCPGDGYIWSISRDHVIRISLLAQITDGKGTQSSSWITTDTGSVMTQRVRDRMISARCKVESSDASKETLVDEPIRLRSIACLDRSTDV